MRGNLKLIFQRILQGSVLFLLVSCSEQTLFISVSIAEKANRILSPLEKLIQLKINQNQLIVNRKKLFDEANQLVIEINEALHKQNPILLEAYQTRERREDESRLVYQANQIDTRVRQLKVTVDRIRAQAKEPVEEIIRLMKEINIVAEEVNLAVEEARQLEEEFPENFTSSLHLVVDTANELKYQAEQFTLRHNELVAEHNQIISEVDRLVRERQRLYTRSNNLPALQNNFNTQIQLRKEQEKIIRDLKANRLEEIKLREQEVNVLQKALELLKTVSRPTPVQESESENEKRIKNERIKN